MQIEDKVVVVTGGARGIGAALARRVAAAGAAAVCVSDRDGAGAAAVAEEIRGATTALATGTDVTVEAEVADLVQRVESELGPIDLFCSNAGVATGAGVEASNEDWTNAWSVNVLAHVYAARYVLPSMLERGEGYLLQTCAAAGLLAEPSSAPYTVSKHAAVAHAEWLALNYGDRGIRVSALCPLGVRTDMLEYGLSIEGSGVRHAVTVSTVLEPEQVAEAVVDGLANEQFLILPHPEVAEWFRRKAAAPDRWLASLRKATRSAPQAETPQL